MNDPKTEIAPLMAGRFIVLDGPDGAGKSSQIKLLAQHLRAQGLTVCEVRDPGGTVIGDKIRAILLDKAHDEMSVECETMLYMASRAQLVSQVIRPALADRQCVLCDRFISSTIAYQGAGGADTAAIRRVGEVAVGGLWPDLTVILDLAHEEGLRRANGRSAAPPDRVESKGSDYHRRVRENFLLQACQDPRRFAVIDAGGTPAEVQQRLQSAIVRHFARQARSGPTG